MQGQCFIDLQRAIAGERLRKYCPQSKAKTNLNLCAYYAWNIALSESLYPVLQGFEIAFRNSIHAAATAHFGNDMWFADPAIMHGNQITLVHDARSKLTGLQPTAGQIVAELTFGFWTYLFSSYYQKQLWNHLLKPVFPNAPASQRNRKILAAELKMIRDLRNRVFHHEPIWGWHDLTAKHQQVLTLLGWINIAKQRFIMEMDRFPQVFAEGVEPYQRSMLAIVPFEEIHAIR